MQLTGAQALVESLIAHRVGTLFALPGLQLDHLFNALHDAGDAIGVIHTRHEQGAGYMAYGFAMATGGVGAYAVVPGPGVLNTTAALSTAYAANARVLCLTGQIPSSTIGRGLGMLHEIPDQLGVLRSLTKWAERIPGPEAVPELMGEAFRQLYAGRPRPVALEMAMDVMASTVEVKPGTATVHSASTPAEQEIDPENLARAGRILGEAEHPLIFVGGGAQEAGAEVAALAETLQAPVIAMRTGRGVLDARNPLSHTMPAGNRLWAQADAVLAVGTRLHYPQLAWGLDDRLRIVRVDIDPAEPARIKPPASTLVGDSGAVLRALLPQVERHNRSRPDATDAMKALKAEIARELGALEPQMSYLKVLREELPEDGIFVDELTQVGYVGWLAFPVYAPRTYITSGYQGTLGAGFAIALGVKLARPDKPVLAISGDGGFLFNAQELATAVQNRIAVVTVVFNDSAFGNVKRMQSQLYGNRLIATNLHNPDFAALAETFGAQGLRADGPEALRAAIRRGFAHDGPTVIEVPVGDMPSPWHMIHLPQVRGVPRRS